jgi:hypothetical protein
MAGKVDRVLGRDARDRLDRPLAELEEDEPELGHPGGSAATTGQAALTAWQEDCRFDETVVCALQDLISHPCGGPEETMKNVILPTLLIVAAGTPAFATPGARSMAPPITRPSMGAMDRSMAAPPRLTSALPGTRTGPSLSGPGRRVGPPTTRFGRPFVASGTRPGRHVGPPSAPLGKGKGLGKAKGRK